jgi:hypothetical protein
MPPVSVNAQTKAKRVSSVEDAATGATAARVRRTLKERAPEQVLADAEALGHAREVPDGLDRRLADVDLDALVDVRERDRGWAPLDDLPIDRQRAARTGRVELRHLDVGPRARDGRSGIEPAVDLGLELGLDHVAPGVERDDPLAVRPGRLGREREWRMRVGIVRLVIGIERVERNREGLVDRVRARVGAGRRQGGESGSCQTGKGWRAAVRGGVD